MPLDVLIVDDSAAIRKILQRVLVQAESHLFNDSGDCAQTLSGLHLVPLGAGQATFTLEEVERAASDAATDSTVNAGQTCCRSRSPECGPHSQLRAMTSARSLGVR